ncbi:MAG: carboxypeptidase-like regulatory domain-containing protein [Proteobacteria bacterium]|nr:carboxypeptidase-like regulatory domain-containing protein [Pseudomonadota bacterium]
MVKNILINLMLIFIFSNICFGQENYGVIKGRAAYKGEVFSGIKILVYKEKEHIDLTKPDIVAGETKIDGSYEFSIPVGRYYLVALKKKYNVDNFKPEEGDLYCFYSGSPVEVVEKGITYVGFNLIKVGKSKPDKKSNNSGIYGKVFFEGKNLEKSYIYVYKDFKGGFRGPAFIVYPSYDGNFSINLPPGTYYIIARKRAKGGMYGPIEEGDLFNFYHGNPVVVKKGYMKNVEIECVKRLSQLESDEGYPILSGVVRDKNGKPLAGIFVLLYHNREMQGKPLYISGRSDSNGNFSIKVPPGKYYILARENIGGPPITGEWTGKLLDPVNIESNVKIQIIMEKTK